MTARAPRERREGETASALASRRAEARGAPPEPHDRAADARASHLSVPLRGRSSRTAARLVGPALVLLALLPAALLVARAVGVAGDLGTDPVETLEQQTGIWALRFLALTLLVTPLRRLTGWNWLAKHRRTLGLAAFAYATTHLLVYLVIDQGLALGFILEDIAEHPWVTIGMATWLMLLPLAVTSTTGWVRRLGGRRWARLHRLTYVCAASGTLHYLLAVKKDIRLPLVYIGIAAVLLGYRLVVHLRQRRGQPAAAAS